MDSLNILDKQIAIKYIDIRVNKRYDIVTSNEKKRKFLKGWLRRDKMVLDIIQEYY